MLIPKLEKNASTIARGGMSCSGCVGRVGSRPLDELKSARVERLRVMIELEVEVAVIVPQQDVHVGLEAALCRRR